MIEYKGNGLTEGVKLLDIRRPLLPPQQLSMVSIEKRSGAFYYDNRSDILTIELDFMAYGNNNMELRQNLREFAEYIHSDKPAKLVLGDEPDRYVMAILEGDTGLDNFFRVGKGTLSMVVPDPYYYAIEDDVYSYSSTDKQVFNRKGNADSYPVVEIMGTTNGGSLTVVTDHNSIEYAGELIAGEVLVLDSDLLTGYVLDNDNNKRSAIPYLKSLDFPVLTKGSNSIRVSTSNGAVLDKYTVRCNSRWL